MTERPWGVPCSARALHRLLTDDDDGGDLLVFLPGAPEIRRVRALLEQVTLPGRPELVPLYGALSTGEQDRALARGAGRRVVLATNIAETSLTVPGVTAVVDTGLRKQPRFDDAVGLDRLELGSISRSSATQRAGRAGRLGPGRAVRLWSAAEHVGFPEADLPEIKRVDLAHGLLAVLTFRPGDPSRFGFFEPPKRSRLDAALQLLRRLGAVEPTAFGLTGLGRRLALLPVHPRVGAMLEAARLAGMVDEGALMAALLAERDILQRSAEVPTCESDLLHRRELFLELERARFHQHQARRLGVDHRAARAVAQARDQLRRVTGRTGGARDRPSVDADVVLRRLPLAGYPDRVCRRRTARGRDATMVGGRGVRLGDESGVREAELFVALVADAGSRGTHAASLVRQASAVELADLEALFPHCLGMEEETLYDEQQDRVVGVRRRRFEDLVLRRETASPTGAAEVLAAAAAERFDEIFRPDRKGQQIVARLRLAAEHLPAKDVPWPDASVDGLRALLPELCVDTRCRGLDDLRRLDWGAALGQRLTFPQRSRLERELPERIEVPSGRTVMVDYHEATGPAGAPVLAVKLQELFGLADTPSVLGGRLPLTLHLLAPNGRPVQVTSDLRSFWNETYQLVRKDLRGRYPKHPWPEDPWSAQPTAKTKRRR